jgi:hypothetical protein
MFYLSGNSNPGRGANQGPVAQLGRAPGFYVKEALPSLLRTLGGLLGYIIRGAESRVRIPSGPPIIVLEEKFINNNEFVVSNIKLNTAGYILFFQERIII